MIDQSEVSVWDSWPITFYSIIKPTRQPNHTCKWRLRIVTHDQRGNRHPEEQALPLFNNDQLICFRVIDLSKWFPRTQNWNLYAYGWRDDAEDHYLMMTCIDVRSVCVCVCVCVRKKKQECLCMAFRYLSTLSCIHQGHWVFQWRLIPLSFSSFIWHFYWKQLRK